MHIGDSLHHAGEVATDLCTWLMMTTIVVFGLYAIVALFRSQTSENNDEE